MKVSIVFWLFRNFNIWMKTLKGAGLTSKCLGIGFGHASITLTQSLGIGFGHASITLTRCRKSSRVVPLQELAIDGQHTSVTLYVLKSICTVGEDLVDDEGSFPFWFEFAFGFVGKNHRPFYCQNQVTLFMGALPDFLSKDPAVHAW